jgi:hypothetical protein
MELNSRGKQQPRAVGLKEDMQGDVRYEFDSVLSIDKETHGCTIVKDRIGYMEIRNTSSDPEAPLTVADGEMLAKLVSEGLTLEEIAQRKIEHYVKFILDEKAHKSTKVGILESKRGEFTEQRLRTFDYDTLTKIVKYLNS